ncbi:hypothetical protein G6514_000294 [Epicoccum nigrum]|nr:hypothetical protein G6514_000294 [Epicoccum nigrum]
MKLSMIVIGAISASTIFECTYAYPGMGSTIREIEERIQQRKYRPGFRRLPKRQPAKVADPNKVDNPNAVDPIEAADPNAATDPNEVEDPNEAEDPTEVEAPLIGDIKDGGSTPVGQAIARIVTEQESGQSDVGGYKITGQLGSAKCKDPRTSREWAKFSQGPEGQSDWNEDYAYSYIRLSLLGVNNINNLTECTKVLPMPTKSFRGAGDSLIAD